MSSSTASSFHRLDFVVIGELKSEAGQRLIGAVGIILEDLPVIPSTSTSTSSEAKAATDATTEEEVRYPVRIFQLNEQQVMRPDQHEHKKIKAENLHLLFKFNNKEIQDIVKTQFVPYFIKATQPPPCLRAGADPVKALKSMAFWCEVYHHYWPEDLEYGMTYLSVLLEMQKYPKVIELVDYYRPLIHPSQDNYYKSLYVFCKALVHSKERLQEALDTALEIPADYTEAGELLRESLGRLEVVCREICEDDVHPVRHPEVRDIYLQVCQAARDYKFPNNEQQAATNLAMAHLHAGHFLKAVRLFRKALALSSKTTGQQQRKHIFATKYWLCIAQLQLPGMPLENYKVLVHHKGARKIGILNKEHLDRGDVVSERHPETGTTEKVFRVRYDMSNDVDYQVYDVPTDPDGPNQWPPILFDEILANLEEEEDDDE